MGQEGQWLVSPLQGCGSHCLVMVRVSDSQWTHSRSHLLRRPFSGASTEECLLVSFLDFASVCPHHHLHQLVLRLYKGLLDKVSDFHLLVLYIVAGSLDCTSIFFCHSSGKIPRSAILLLRSRYNRMSDVQFCT